jgi:hypothetical protein
LAKHILESCPYLNFKGIMSMGEIGNIEEFKLINQLKERMLNEFKIKDD